MKTKNNAHCIFVYSYDKQCNTILNQSNFNSVYCYHQKNNAIARMNELYKQHEKTGHIDRVDHHDLDCHIIRIITNQGYFFELTELLFNDNVINKGDDNV